MSYWGQKYFQDAGSNSMMKLIDLYGHSTLVLVMVMSTVSVFFFFLLTSPFAAQCYRKEETAERIWTFVPAILLVIIAAPSLRLLYEIDEVGSPEVTLKIIGHQWYWSYEYSDFRELALDSYMVPAEDLSLGGYRLLEVDHRVCLPCHTSTRLSISSADVIHCWAVPSMGLKVDAIPGRINQVTITPNVYGVFYGMCSEICGANHAFMPIVVEVVPSSVFSEWKDVMSAMGDC